MACSRCSRRRWPLLLALVAGAVWLYRRRMTQVGVQAGPAPAPAPTWTPVDPDTGQVGVQAGPRPAPAPTWVEPVGGECPEGYPVKVAASGIYHVPGGRSYDRTTPVRCYADAASAEADGYRQAKV